MTCQKLDLAMRPMANNQQYKGIHGQSLCTGAYTTVVISMLRVAHKGSYEQLME